ncbi:MAG: hypothetical protein GY714_13190, partial [Desulfobacterales bacterium]|nr:hypothetical protein [Desulfobacterales bacterium]
MIIITEKEKDMIGRGIDIIKKGVLGCIVRGVEEEGEKGIAPGLARNLAREMNEGGKNQEFEGVEKKKEASPARGLGVKVDVVH